MDRKPQAEPPLEPFEIESDRRTFGSLFDGIHGFGVGLRAAGFSCDYTAEIDPTCNAVRRRHYSDGIEYESVESVPGTHRPTVVCAGWPCQGNSVAGKRGGLADERSGLWWEVHRILAEQSPTWFFGENVPGILSVNGGRDWLTVIRSLEELGYGYAWRVFDAQWFGVAQRRRRVFLIGCLGDAGRAARVLFEPESLPWNPPPSRETGTRVAASIAASAGHHGYSSPRGDGQDNIVPTLARSDTTREGQRLGDAQDTLIPFVADDYANMTFEQADTARPLSTSADRSRAAPLAVHENQRGEVTLNETAGSLKTGGGKPGQGFPAVAYQCHGSNVGPMGTMRSGNGNETGGVPFTIHGTDKTAKVASETDIAGSLRTKPPGSQENSSTTVVAQPFAFEPRIGRNDRGQPSEVVNTLKGSEAGETSDMRPCVASGAMRVRRLMPIECERLMGYPDNWTRYRDDGTEISNSARYRMLGNSVVPACIEWIGRRIAESTL